MNSKKRHGENKNSRYDKKRWFLQRTQWMMGSAMGNGQDLISGIILIPIMVLIAFILPGNKTLPVVDLIAIPYMIESNCRGNIVEISLKVIATRMWFTF